MIKIGTIMEIHKNEVLVITADFELVHVKRTPEMFQGLQIGFGDSDVIRNENKNKKVFFASGIAAILIFTFIVLFAIQNSGFENSNTAYAFIDLDINPSIEFMIDDKDTVQMVLPLNSDAENINKVLSLEKLPVKEAIKKVIDRSLETGILKSDKTNVIMITASLNPENSDYKVRKASVEFKLNQLLASLKAVDGAEPNDIYSIKVLKVEPEVKKQAVKNGLSAGRQLILKKAQSEGIALSLDEVKSGSLPVLMKKVGIDQQNTGQSFLSTPVVISPDKVTTAVKTTYGKIKGTGTPTPGKVLVEVIPTSQIKTEAPAQIRKPTPAPVPDNIKPTDANTTHYSKTGSIKIQYYNISKKVSNVIQINSVFKIINTGNTTINLEDVTFRYYYTIDGEKPQSIDSWAQEGKSNMTYRFVKMSKPLEKADYYIEVGFKSGKLDPGKYTVVVTWFNKDDWSTYKQDNDYSYNSSSLEDYYDWKYVTGYISNTLKWGIEPVH